MEITLVTLFVAVLVGEAILLWTWSPMYFRFGIPLLRHEAKVFATGGEMPSAEDLAEQLHESRYPPLVFRALGAGTYAFREHTGRALAALCGWIYSIQRRRFREAAMVAAQLWAGDLIQPS